MASGIAILFVTVGLTTIGGNSSHTEPPALTSFKHVFTEGFTPMGECRKMEAAFHDGNGPAIKRGNKIISRIETPGGRHTTETTTFCVEI